MTGLEALEPELEAWIAELGIPGVAVGMTVRGEEQILTKGVTSLQTPVPVDEHTLFQVGSTTKTVTATTFLQLVEQGRAEFDAPMTTMLPGLRLPDPQAQEALTPRHLLTHSGGFLGDVEGQDDEFEAGVQRFAALPQLFPPGALASYSNSGFRLLGLLVRALADARYEDVARHAVLDPLGMTESFFLPSQVLTRPHAVGHGGSPGERRVRQTSITSRDGFAEGGLCSSVRDQLRWARFHLDGVSEGEPPLSGPMRLRMREPAMEMGPPIGHVGMPWLIGTRHGQVVVSHGGNVGNLVVSSFDLVPAHRFGVTVLSNSGGGRVLGPRVLDWCFENVLGIDPVARQAPISPRLSAADADQFTGRYDAGQWDVIVQDDDPGLRVEMVLPPALLAEGVEPTPPMRVTVVDGDLLVPTDGGQAVGRFLRDGAGRVTFLHLAGRAIRRADPAPCGRQVRRR